MSPSPALSTTKPLDVVVIGAGISGLCTAIALRQAGHTVTVLEKSQFATPTGAAIALSPNGTHVLSTLGFSLPRARACLLTTFESVDGATLAPLTAVDVSAAARRYGGPFASVHRADFHAELLRLARDPAGDGNPVDVRIGCAAEGVQVGGGFAVRLAGDGERALEPDVVVGADGVRSSMRGAVLGGGGAPAGRGARGGLSSFRVQVPTRRLEAEEGLAGLRAWKSSGATVFADTSETASERHLVWYTCRDGEVQNIAAVHPTRRRGGSAAEDTKAALLAEFGHFHPDIVRLLELADDVGLWDLAYHEPFTPWTRDNAVLIGDAAHAMLPFGAQGANQAIEDAGALGILLRGVQAGTEVRQRLELFEKIRHKRASVIQILSSVRIGQEKTVKEALQPYMDCDTDSPPANFQERTDYTLGYDVLQVCRDTLMMSDATPSRSPCT